MERPIIKDPLFLGQVSLPAEAKDRIVGQDLKDTLSKHREHCVGMAANMIGVKKRVIIIDMGMGDLVMYNPVLLEKSEPYQTD